MSVYGPIVVSGSTGGAGASTANTNSANIINGFIVGVYIQYDGAPPAATTDVTIKTKGSTGVLPSYNLLVVSNAATDGYFAPQEQTVSIAGADTGQYGFFYVSDFINVAIAGANDNDGLTVWLYVVN